MQDAANEAELLVDVEGVGKKYCRNLRRSLWYGLQDVAAELLAVRRPSDRLRPGEFWANQDVSLQLRRGESLGLIGHNGAGKTTLLKMLNGLIKPDRGRIMVRGRVGALIALGAGFNPILSGRENVYINGAVLGYSRREVDELLGSIVDFAELEDFLDAPVQSYSSGMQVRLGFAVAIHLNPDLMLVDEVLAVGDVSFQSKCYERIYEMQKADTAFIVVSHNPYQLERLCSKIAILDAGRLVGVFDGKKAVVEYHRIGGGRRVARGREPATGPEPPETRQGTGAIRLKSLELLDGAGRPTRSVRTAEPAALRLTLHAREPVRDARITLFVYSRSDVLISVVSTTGLSEGRVFEGEETLIFRIPRLDLMTDLYSVEVRIAGRNLRLDRVKRALEFAVQLEDEAALACTGNQGVMLMEGHWELPG